MSKLTFLMKNRGKNTNPDAAASSRRRSGLVNVAARKRTGTRAEEILKESEKKYQNLFEQTMDAVMLIDIETGAIVDANSACAAMFGYSRETMTGMPYQALQPENKKDGYKKYLDERLQKETTFSDDLVYLCAKDKEIQVNISSSVINLNGKRVLQSIFRETTGHNSLLKKMIESEDKFSRAFHASPDAMSISDLTDGKFIEVNESYVRITGYTREELLNKTAADFNMWATPEDLKKMIEPLLRHERLHNAEVGIRAKNGRINTMLVSSEIIQISGRPCLLVVSTDITEYKRMEKALKESEEKFSKAFHAIPERITITRISDGMILDVNDSFLRDRKRTREETIGHTVYEIKLWADHDTRDNLIREIKENGRIVNREMSYTTDKGVTETTLVSSDIININGESCLISISNDITERNRMEEALIASEEKFSKAFMSIPESIAISRVSDGVILDVNDNFCHVAKRSYDEIIGHTDSEINLTQLPGNRGEDIKTIKEKGAIKNREMIFNANTDEMRAILFSADIIDISGEPCVISISTDITERKRMEEAMSDEAVRRRLLIDQSRDGIVIIDQTGAVYEVNLRFAEMHGYTPEEIAKLHIWDWEKSLPPEQLLQVIQTRDQEGVNFETRHYRKDGSVIDVEVSSNGTLYAGQKLVFSVVRDISERKRMEQALRESEEKFSTAFQAIPESVSIATLNGSIFLDVNESFLRSTRFTREQVIGHSVDELKFWSNSEEYKEMVRSVVQNGNLINQERQFVTESGRDVSLLFSANIIQIAGEPCIIIIANNITVLKQAERQLKKALAELQVSSAHLKATNKELESFSYSISHDLRSPLRSIDGFSQALLEDYAPQLDETARDYLNRMRTASQKMGDLIDGLLKLSRLTRNEMHYESVDLSALARDITARKQETEPERKAEFIITPGLKAAGDAQMLRVMLENLLGNAWKFTSKVPLAHIEFGSSVDGEEETFFIKDNGAGFDMTYRDKLFGAFQRLHNIVDFPGTGIGLATVMRIINRHGGSIRAEGVVGQGATFYFTL
jgi:PAS domain S-box-containing protein